MNLLFADEVTGLTETTGLMQQCLYP